MRHSDQQHGRFILRYLSLIKMIYMEWSVDFSEPTLSWTMKTQTKQPDSVISVFFSLTKGTEQQQNNLFKKNWISLKSSGVGVIFTWEYSHPLSSPAQGELRWPGNARSLTSQPTENTELFGAPVKAPAPGDRQSFDKINNSLENPPAQVVSIWFDLRLRSGEESPTPRASMKTIAIYW